MKTSLPSPPPTILVADNNLSDVALIRWVLDAHALPYELQVVEHGDYALYVFDLLAQQERLWSPTMVLLNLNLPQLNGNELLRHIQAIPQEAAIRVVAVTGSVDPREQAEALAMEADGAFVKSFHLTPFMQLGELIEGLVHGNATANEPLKATAHGTGRRRGEGSRVGHKGRLHQPPPASGTPPRPRWRRRLAWSVGLGLIVGVVWGAPWLSRRPPLVPISPQIHSDHAAPALPAAIAPAALSAAARPPAQSQTPAERVSVAGATPEGITPGAFLQRPRASVVRSVAQRGHHAVARPRAAHAGHSQHAGWRYATRRPAVSQYLVQARDGAGSAMRPREVERDRVVGAHRPEAWTAALPAPQPPSRWGAPDPAPEVERPWNRRIVNDTAGE
jgi:CheY-like chemotaxis protein